MAAADVGPRGRLIGLDLGTRRIGVAVCDSGRMLATGVRALERSGVRARDHARIAEVVADYDAVGVVVGVPWSLSGTAGPAARAALDEVDELSAALPVPVVTVDERLTTVVAAGALRAGGRTARQARGVVDQAAAATLLQSFLDRSRQQGR